MKQTQQLNLIWNRFASENLQPFPIWKKIIIINNAMLDKHLMLRWIYTFGILWVFISLYILKRNLTKLMAWDAVLFVYLFVIIYNRSYCDELISWILFGKFVFATFTLIASDFLWWPLRHPSKNNDCKNELFFPRKEPWSLLKQNWRESEGEN